MYIHTCIKIQFSPNKWGSTSKETGLTGEVTWTDAPALALKNCILKCSHLYKKSICTVCTPPPQSIILEILEMQYSGPGKRYPHSKYSWTRHHGRIPPHGISGLQTWTRERQMSIFPDHQDLEAEQPRWFNITAKKSGWESSSSRNIKNNCSK